MLLGLIVVGSTLLLEGRRSLTEGRRSLTEGTFHQVPRRTKRRRVHENRTKKWAERSVWTMVCAIELGLIKPPTATFCQRKWETRGRKSDWARKGMKSKEPAPKKAIDSLANVHIDNSRRNKPEDSHRSGPFLEHRYSLAPTSEGTVKLDAPLLRNFHYNEKKTFNIRKSTVYNPFNRLRNNKKKIDIYEYNRGIKNQTGPRQMRDCSADRADASHHDFLQGADEIQQTLTIKHKKLAKSSKIEDRTCTVTSTTESQRIPPKRQYFRRKHRNPYAMQANTWNSVGKEEPKADAHKLPRLCSGSSKKKITETLYREIMTSSVKGLDDHIDSRKDAKIDEAINCGFDYDDSEFDESLMVDPSTDLPGALLSVGDIDNDPVDLSSGFDVSLDVPFEAMSLIARLDSSTREKSTKRRYEIDCNEFDEFEKNVDRSYFKSYVEADDKEITRATDEKTLAEVDKECEKRNDRSCFKSYVKAEDKEITWRIDEKILDEVDNDPEKSADDRSVGKTGKKKPDVRKIRKENGNSAIRPAKRRYADWFVTDGMEDKENASPKNGVRVTRGSMKNGALSENNNETGYTVGTVVWGNCTGWWPGLIVDAEDVGMCSTEGKSWVYWIGEHRISELRNRTQIQRFSTGIRARMIETLRTKTQADEDYASCLATIRLLNDEILDKGPLTEPYDAWVERHVMRLDNIDEIIMYPYPSNVQRRLDELKRKNSEATEKYLSDLRRSAEKPATARVNGTAKSAVKQIQSTDPGQLPLMSQKPGVIAWAKIMGQIWWPAMIIDFRDCGMKEPTFGCQWILWYGDDTLSQVNHQFFLAFEKGIVRMRDYVLNCKRDVYRRGVLDAAKDYAARYGYKTDSWTMEEAFDWFEKIDECESTNGASSCLPGIPGSDGTTHKYPARIVEGLKKHKGNCTLAAIREHNIKNSDDLRSVVSGKSDIKALCLMCLKRTDDEDKKIEHPFFEGELCEECSEKYKPTIFAYGDDGKCFFCTVCAGSDTVVMCDGPDCPRVYCTACIKYLIAPRAYDQIMLNDPWLCFLCEVSPITLDGVLSIPRTDWKKRVAGLFHANRESVPGRVEHYKNGKEKIRVLSLFDGISAGLVVLRKLAIEVDVYYASEIDPDAEMVSSAQFGNEIVRLGDVREIDEKKIREIGPIDLLIGGSPCNDLSLVNPMRLGLHDPNGTGVLVFEYCRVKDLVRKVNGNRHFFWLFENVASMPSKYRTEINEHFGREPELIDSADYSPQHRPRLYWSNLPTVSYPISSQDLQDVLTPNCNRHALVKKIRTVTTRVNSLKQGKNLLKPILMNEQSDSVWITELEEIFGFPRHYTDVKNLCATKRQKLIGMSWSVQTITEIMRPLCNFFKVRNVDSS